MRGALSYTDVENMDVNEREWWMDRLSKQLKKESEALTKKR